MYCLSDTFAIDLLLLSTTVALVGSARKNMPMMCNQTEPWKLGGRDVVADSKGFVLLVALMPVRCEHCHKQLMKFQAVAETLPEIRIVVVAPYDENPRLIERYREEFPRVAIGMESVNERVWDSLSGSAHDHFIYDRCGRLASVIRHPKSDTTKFEDTVRALKLVVSYAQCGWCEYDPPDLPAPRKPVAPTSSPNARKSKLKTPRIKAVVHPSTASDNDKIPSRTGTDRRQLSASADERSYLRTNTVAPVHGTHLRTSTDFAPSPTTAKVPSAATRNYQKLKVTSSELLQQQRVSQQEEQTLQQRRFDTDQQQQQQQQHQRRIIIRPDKDLPKTVALRKSKGWTVSHQFPSRTRQHENQERERAWDQESHQQREQGEEERKYQQEQERRRQQEQEQKRIIEVQQQRNREQQEEERRIQVQHRWQEERRRLLQQQQLQQQEQERRIEERRRLQEQQRTESELYSDDDDDRRDREEQWRPVGEQPRQQQQHIQQAQPYASTTRAPFGLSGLAAKTPSLYDSVEEGDYDYSQMVSETTTTTTVSPAVKGQIPGTEPPGAWPTPFFFEQQVPCAAFTDEVCLQQKKTMGNDKMNKCCDKGIYLTDVCMPGRCTNATTELCCMQKFLQSKYKCCLNDSEAINSPGDAFSRCCFSNFVHDDDKCCPAERAKFHWSTAYEVCLPNVRVDLSGLRFSVHRVEMNGNGGESSGSGAASALGHLITIDLNEDRSWDHSCQQGASVLQFPYLPSDELGHGERVGEGK